MTCFWDGILRGLYEAKKLDNIPTIQNFIQFLKDHNERTPTILHNCDNLRSKLIDENIVAIQNINPIAIGQGYDCSSCDPVLILISHLFETNIHHLYCNNMISYTNPRASTVLKFSSSTSHFSLG